MSRKVLLPGLTPAPKTNAPTSRTRPLMGSPDLTPDARPVGAVSQSLTEISDKAKRADEIEKKLIEGQVIVELDPALIDPSFVADRMPISSKGLESLRVKIRDHGQLNPILVRPHPEIEGRYQVAFGHRRLRAVKEIGRSVRAVVRKLSDEELVIAQGQENHEREDLSYIEKVQFAARLEKRGFKREPVIASALSVYKSDLSVMLSVARKIPEKIITAIGSAPGVGRRSWIELAELVEDHIQSIERAISQPDFAGMESDDRFKAVLQAAKPQREKAKSEVWSLDGKPLAKVVQDEGKVSLAIDRRKSPEFADFVLNRLRDLYQEFEAKGS